MAKPHKAMSGMEMLMKINAPKKRAETSLQNLGRAIATHEASRKNTLYGKRVPFMEGVKTLMDSFKKR